MEMQEIHYRPYCHDRSMPPEGNWTVHCVGSAIILSKSLLVFADILLGTELMV